MKISLIKSIARYNRPNFFSYFYFLIQRKGNFNNHHWGCKSIYRPLSYPLRSVQNPNNKSRNIKPGLTKYNKRDLSYYLTLLLIAIVCGRVILGIHPPSKRFKPFTGPGRSFALKNNFFGLAVCEILTDTPTPSYY